MRPSRDGHHRSRLHRGGSWTLRARSWATHVIVPVSLLGGAAMVKGVPALVEALHSWGVPDGLRIGLGVAGVLVGLVLVAPSIDGLLDPARRDEPLVGAVVRAVQITGLGFFAIWLFGSVAYQVGLPVAAWAAWRRESRPDVEALVEKALLYMLVMVFGVGGIYGFVGHTVLAEDVARSIGWSAGSGFQTELAFYHLGTGVAGLLGIWIRGHLWTAVIVSKSIFAYGANVTHVLDIVATGNLAPGNAGFAVLFGNVFSPSLMLVLLALYLRRGSPAGDGPSGDAVASPGTWRPEAIRR